MLTHSGKGGIYTTLAELPIPTAASFQSPDGQFNTIPPCGITHVHNQNIISSDTCDILQKGPWTRYEKDLLKNHCCNEQRIRYFDVDSR